MLNSICDIQNPNMFTKDTSSIILARLKRYSEAAQCIKLRQSMVLDTLLQKMQSCKDSRVSFQLLAFGCVKMQKYMSSHR